MCFISVVAFVKSFLQTASSKSKEMHNTYVEVGKKFTTTLLFSIFIHDTYVDVAGTG